MLKPSKPYEPTKPKVPEKIVNRENQIWIDEGITYITDILKDLPKNISINDCFIKYETSDDYYQGCCGASINSINIIYYTKEINEKYDKELVDYNKKLKVYDNKMLNYQKEMELYNQKVIDYEKVIKQNADILKQKEIKKLEKQLKKLKSDSRK